MGNSEMLRVNSFLIGVHKSGGQLSANKTATSTYKRCTIFSENELYHFVSVFDSYYHIYPLNNVYIPTEQNFDRLAARIGKYHL